MKPSWLLEDDVFNENLDNIKKSITDQGMEYVVEKYVPFEGSKKYLELFTPDKCVIFYGSLNFGRQIQREAKWIPGLYCNLPLYLCSNYYGYFGGLLLNNNYVMLPFGDLIRRKSFLFSSLDYGSGHLFIRPNSGFKTFTGTSIGYHTYEQDIHKIGYNNIDQNELVIVASFQNIEREWRTVVVDGRIIAWSEYKTGDGEVPTEVIKYANDVLAETKFNPERAWTLDICQDEYRRLHVLEIGGFSCAGLYDCNTDDVVREVSRTAIEEWQEYQ